MEIFANILARPVASLGEFCTQQHEPLTKFPFESFYNYYLIHFSVGRIFIIPSPSD